MPAFGRHQHRPPFGVARVLVPGFLIYILFSTLFGFFFVFSEDLQGKLARTKGIVIDLSEGHEGRLVLAGEGLLAHRTGDGPTLMARAKARLAFGAIQVGAVALGLIASLAYHRPLILFFRRARREGPDYDRIAAAAKARISASPSVMATATAVPIAVELALRVALGGLGRAEDRKSVV
jgi:hypothetical protein